MAKLESPREVRRILQREELSDIPTEKTIRNIYDKFLETGSVQDRERPGRSSSVTEEKKEQIAEILAKIPMTSVRKVSQEVNMSKLFSYDALCIEVQTVQNAPHTRNV